MADFNLHPEDWPVISRRLDEALALGETERTDWLAALAESESIKSILARLLVEAAGLETDDFLRSLPRFGMAQGPMPGTLAADGRHAGAEVGPYRLLAELGRGGMGSVWLAERGDGQPRRKVALKLPHIGWAPGLVERLARERDILASLEHPNIARLYDAGTDALGRPYLAMEYVDGIPIDAHCAAVAAPLRVRLDLLRRVASAVAYAHTRLVVHRDLKPSNILVTQTGDVRLLDFGIAKLMQSEGEDGELTRAGTLALTPAYASPEQLRGQPVGTHSDVYGLGVVAYELLTGRRPHEVNRKSGATEIADDIARSSAPLASRVAADPVVRRLLVGDLDAILRKALKYDPAERYATVGAFLDDIERHLRHAPVAARPDTLAYRARTFLRRYAVHAAAAAAVLVSLIAGSAIAVWQARQARHEAARAEQVKDFALSIVSGADTESGANRETTATELLLEASHRVARDVTASDETAVELMTAIGAGLQSQGRVDDAVELLRAADERASRTLGRGHPRTLAAATAYGTALLGSDRPKEAIALLQEVVDESRRSGDVPARIAALRELSSAQLAAAEGEAGLVSAREAVSALRGLRSPLPPLQAFHAWGQLANALNVTHQPGLVEASRQALAEAQQVYGDRLTDNVLAARMLLAKGLADEGQDTAALDSMESVYADVVRLFGADHPRIEAVANFLGTARANAGDLDGAVAAYRAALAAGEKSHVGGGGGNLGIGHFVLGRALAGQHRDAEALAQFEESARLLAAAIGPDSVFTLRSRSAAAGMLARLGRLDESARAFDALAKSSWPAAEGAQHEGRLALLRSLQDRHDEAIALARSAVTALGPAAPRNVRANAQSVLGRVLIAAGRPGDAVMPLREATRLYSEQMRVVSPDHAQADAALSKAQTLSLGAIAPR